MPLAKNLIEAAGNATQANYIEDVFSTYLATGAGTSFTINNGIDLSTKGGMAWMKRRSSTQDNYVFDTVRGAGKALVTNSTAAEYNNSQIDSFTTTGFTGSFLASASTNVFWTFRKQPKFFDVVTYTGNGTSGRTVAHSLGSVPACIIVKRTDTAADWSVYHVSTGNGYATALNSNLRPVGPIAGFWNSTTPTSTEFTVGNHSTTNANGGTYVAYILASNAGGFGLTGTDNVITCSSFTTDGSGNATVNLGYEPQWVLIRNITRNTVDWHIDDSMRGMPTSGQSRDLKPNLSDAETGNPLPNPTATGFTVTGVADFGGADTYIYIAIRRGPMKVPTDATKVFKPMIGNDGTFNTTNFVVDMVADANQGGSSFNTAFMDRLRAGAFSKSSSTAAETANYPQGFQSNTAVSPYIFSPTNSIMWAFGRAPSFFDEVCYTGTGANRTVTHNLQAVPEMMFVFRRDSASSDRRLYSSALGNQYYMSFNQNYATQGPTAILWNNTSPTSSVFTVGTYSDVNASGGTYVAYLFATCAGVSKVGNYTGTGTTKQVDCGFAAGARFVLIKKTSGTGSWYVWDSARGIVSGNDPYLLLNSTAAEVTSTDYIDTYAAGFEISSTAPSEINENGGSFIFLAIA